MIALGSAAPVTRPLDRLSQRLRHVKSIPQYANSSKVSLASSKCQSPQGSVLGEIPVDIWELVFTHLCPPELLKLALLNSVFHHLVTKSLPWRFFQSLFPTSRPIWALTWAEAYRNYISRTIPPRGTEPGICSMYWLPQDKPFEELFVGTGRKVIEFIGPCVRHRNNTYLTQTDPLALTCTSWKISSVHAYSMGEITQVKKVMVELPPRGHHLRPAGLDVVGTFLFWVDFLELPLEHRIGPEGIEFDDDIGQNVLWPDRVFNEEEEELCLLHKLFISWGESQFNYSGQMVSALDTVASPRKQVLWLYDYDSRTEYSIPFDKIIGNEGPWLGKWVSPWILPWGFDDDGNLLFKILDTRTVNNVERLRCVQVSFSLEKMAVTFAVEILEDIQLLSPWNFQLFSDQCWGYPARDSRGNIWCVLRDLRDGNVVRRLGPLNLPGTQPTDYACHISTFHVIFQDKSSRALDKTPLRIFPINPLPHHIRNEFRIPPPLANGTQLLYDLQCPNYGDQPGFWSFAGEDVAERYLFFQGTTTDVNDAGIREDWRKWVIWDNKRRAWTVTYGFRDWGSDGFYCLYTEVRGGIEVVALDWIRLEL